MFLSLDKDGDKPLNIRYKNNKATLSMIKPLSIKEKIHSALLLGFMDFEFIFKLEQI